MERQLPTGRATNQLEIVVRNRPREFAIRTTTGPTPFVYRYRCVGEDDKTVVRRALDRHAVTPGATEAVKQERADAEVRVSTLELFFLLLSIILVASGLKSAIPRPFGGLPTASATMLATGTAMFVAADDAMTRVLGISGKRRRNAAVGGASVATIPVGEAVSATAQIASLFAILAIATAVATLSRDRN
jgi:hypothetical protein